MIDGQLVEVRVWRTGVHTGKLQEPHFVVLLIKFNRYIGSVRFKDLELTGVVPIFRHKRNFLKGNTNGSRT